MNQKVLGSATEGVALNALKAGVCSAYTGPKSSYPAECVKLAGEQKEFAPEAAVVVDKTDKPLAAAGEKSEVAAAPAVPEEEVNEGVQAPAKENAVVSGNVAVDVKPAEATPAVANVPTTAAVTGKVKLDMYWRAFWYVIVLYRPYCCYLSADMGICAAPGACRSSRDPCFR